MFLKVLVDNNTVIDDYALGEPGLCFYLEVDNKKILFDTGYSDILINNAKHYNLDLNQLDYIVLSHGHNDHTRGLQFLFEEYDLSKTILIAHPDVFNDKIENDTKIGSPLKLADVKNKMKVILTKEAYKLTDNLYFLGEIKRTNDFENKAAIGKQYIDDEWKDDYLYDDSALGYQNKGLYIITGCSHSGICNIVETAKRLFNEDRIKMVIGGFHLFEDDDNLKQTIAYFKINKIENLLPCHCVSFKAKARINQEIPIQEVGVGFEIKL